METIKENLMAFEKSYNTLRLNESSSIETDSMNSQTAEEEQLNELNFHKRDSFYFDDYGDFEEMDFEQMDEDVCSYQAQPKRHYSKNSVRRFHKSEIETADPMERMLRKLEKKLPGVDSISLGPQELTDGDSCRSKSFTEKQGYFADPLTGVYIDEDIKLPDKEEEAEEESLETSIEAEAESDFTEFSFESYDGVFQEISTKIAETVKAQENMLLTFDDQLVRSPAIEYKSRTTETDTEIQVSTEAYLKDLLNDVLKLVSEESATVILRKQLDKSELFEQLNEDYKSLMAERRINYFLVGRGAVYYHRRGMTSYLKVQKASNFPNEHRRYTKICVELDELLGRELFFANRIKQKTRELMNQVITYEETQQTNFFNFEKLVRKALKCEPKSWLSSQIDKQLEEIVQLQREISEVRSDLVEAQHKLETLKRQKNDVETIGDSLKVDDFQILYDEMQLLDKVVDDRHTLLMKRHQDLQKNFHITANLKVKKASTIQRIKIQRWILYQHEREQAEYRKRLCQSRLEQQRTRQKLNELRWRNGMLDKPTLLNDFDRTLELLETKHQEIDQMRKVYEELTQKIEQQEKRMSLKEEEPKTSKDLKPSPKHL